MLRSHDGKTFAPRALVFKTGCADAYFDSPLSVGKLEETFERPHSNRAESQQLAEPSPTKNVRRGRPLIRRVGQQSTHFCASRRRDLNGSFPGTTGIWPVAVADTLTARNGATTANVLLGMFNAYMLLRSWYFMLGVVPIIQMDSPPSPRTPTPTRSACRWVMLLTAKALHGSPILACACVTPASGSRAGQRFKFIVHPCRQLVAHSLS
jgi:hypothetical protein